MSITVIANIVPLPEHADEVSAVLVTAVNRVRAEDAGCERYELNVDATTGAFVMLERWADEAALSAHSKSPAFLALGAGIDGKLASPLDVRTLTPVAI